MPRALAATWWSVYILAGSSSMRTCHSSKRANSPNSFSYRLARHRTSSTQSHLCTCARSTSVIPRQKKREDIRKHFDRISDIDNPIAACSGKRVFVHLLSTPLSNTLEIFRHSTARPALAVLARPLVSIGIFACCMCRACFSNDFRFHVYSCDRLVRISDTLFYLLRRLLDSAISRMNR